MRLRDETHRRAVGYYRKRRGKRLTASELDMIPGIGPKRKKELLKYFGDIGSLATADIEELRQVPGINQAMARDIFDYFHGKSFKGSKPVP